MSAAAGPPRGQPAPSGAWIPWLFVAFFAVVLAANGTLVWLALGSWTGLVSDRAYEDGLAYNRNLEAARAQAELGWRSELSTRMDKDRSATVELTLRDAAGAPVEDAEVEATLERPTRAGEDVRVALAHRAGGVYRGTSGLPGPGLWTVHVAARRGAALHVRDARVLLR